MGIARGPSIFASPDPEHVNPMSYPGRPDAAYPEARGHVNPMSFGLFGLANPADIGRGVSNPNTNPFGLSPAATPSPEAIAQLTTAMRGAVPSGFPEEDNKDVYTARSVPTVTVPGRTMDPYDPIGREERAAREMPWDVPGRPGVPEPVYTSPPGRQSYAPEGPTSPGQAAISTALGPSSPAGVPGGPMGGGDMPNRPESVASVPTVERATGIDMTAFAANVSSLVGAQITPEQAATLASNPRILNELLAMMSQIDPTIIDRLRTTPTTTSTTTAPRMFDRAPMGMGA